MIVVFFYFYFFSKGGSDKFTECITSHTMKRCWFYNLGLISYSVFTHFHSHFLLLKGLLQFYLFIPIFGIVDSLSWNCHRCHVLSTQIRITTINCPFKYLHFSFVPDINKFTIKNPFLERGHQKWYVHRQFWTHATPIMDIIFVNYNIRSN